jgi:hypothetical protein
MINPVSPYSKNSCRLLSAPFVLRFTEPGSDAGFIFGLNTHHRN